MIFGENLYIFMNITLIEKWRMELSHDGANTVIVIIGGCILYASINHSTNQLRS